MDDLKALDDCFADMRASFSLADVPPVAKRLQMLKSLMCTMQKMQPDFLAAINTDFGTRSNMETLLTEYMPLFTEIKYINSNLHRWLRGDSRAVPWWAWPSTAETLRQPLGVVGIIAPWNYPIFTALSPVIGALACGNKVLLKPSEFLPTTNAVLEQCLDQAIGRAHVRVVNGGPEVSRKFSSLPFDHLFFTGSTAVGREVMAAASVNPTPVTLELGGKSPVIIADDYSIAKAARAIVQGKCLNAGQTCVAPDYVFVPLHKREKLVEKLLQAFKRMYPDYSNDPNYTSMISERGWQRCQDLLADARNHGAEVLSSAPLTAESNSQRKLPLQIVTYGSPSMRLLKEEIFAPILPIVTYTELDQVIELLQNEARPLALYVFASSEDTQRYIQEHTYSGGVTVNNTLLHVAQPTLPFGGIGASGIGKYHGRYSIELFSHEKAIFTQRGFALNRLFNPPYTRRQSTWLKWLLNTLSLRA